MKIYNYDKQTGELLGGSIARENPLEQGKYLIPSNSTIKEPIVPEDGHVAVFKDDEWTSVEDIRGTWYNIREEVEVTSLDHDMTGLTKEPVPYTAEELAQQAEDAKPKSVTMRQARLALLQSGLLQTVTDAIANGTDEAMKIEWEYATSIERDWASLIALTEALGMTSQKLDDLFLLASAL